MKSLRETRLVIRDLRGRRFRTGAVVISVALLVSLLFSTSVLEVGAQRVSLAGSEKFGADMMVLAPISPVIFSYETATSPIFVVSQPDDFINASAVGDLLRLPGITAASPQLYVANLNTSSSGVSPRLVAFDPTTDFVIRPWLNGAPEALQPDQAVAGPSTGVSVGTVVRYRDLALRVVSVLRPTNSSLDQTILFPLGAAFSLNPVAGNGGGVSAIMVKLAPDALLNTVEAEIKDDLGSYKLVEASGLVSRVRVDTTGIASYETLAEIIMAASVFLLMALVFSMTTNEQSRQLGILRSLGASNRFIFLNVLKEAGLAAVIGSLLGLALGELVVSSGENYLVATFNTSVMSPDFLESLGLTLRSLVLGIITGAAAALIPAYRIIRRDPYEAIRRGE